MRYGRRLGIDLGRSRVGVARCDPEGVLATPVATIARKGLADGTVAAQVARMAEDAGAFEIVIGWPIHLAGGIGESAADVRSFGSALAARWPGSIRLLDERLSTVQASGMLREVGRSEKASRAVIDQVAATVILQAALDEERASGRSPGQALDSGAASDKGVEE
jgi:putative Holliday junction resolvase